jgi:hypothetical protein
MSIDYTAYAAFGVHIPDPPYDDDNDRDAEQSVDYVLGNPDVKRLCPDVGHLTTSSSSGSYTGFYLITVCGSTGPGEHTTFEPGAAQELAWTRQLAVVLRALGWDDHLIGMPSWFVTLNVS